MDEMKVYIVNLGKYVEGEDAGAWFTLPVDKDVVAERLGLDSRYEEIAIHDYELPFQIGEYESLDELNRLAGLIEDLPDDVQANLSDLIDEFGSVDDVAEVAEDLIYYDGCSVEDVAMELIEDSGALDGLPEDLRYYFDYEAYARDLKINGDLIECSRGVFVR